MTRQSRRWIATVLCFLSLVVASGYCSSLASQPPAGREFPAVPVAQQPVIPVEELRNLRAALDQLDAYIGAGPNGQAWREFLLVDELKQQAELNTAHPDIAVVGTVLERFQSREPGLEKRQFARVRTAIEAWLDWMPPPPAGMLATQASEAKGNYRRASEADLVQARQRLAADIGRLDGYLTKGGKNGLSWKQYLLWDELSTALVPSDKPEAQPPPKPNPEALARVLTRFRGNQPGLELPQFATVARSLEQYLDLVRQAENPNAKTQFEAAVDSVAAALDALNKEQSPATLEALSAAVGELERQRQAAKLTDAIRRAYSRPNLLVQAAQGFVSAGMARAVDEEEPVRDLILGTRISGRGRTQGEVQIRFVPDPLQAVFEAELVGTNSSRTVGRNGPALVYSRGTTRLHARKRLMVNDEGIVALDATADAEASTRITGVGSTKRGIVDCLVRRIAERKIPQQKRAAERIASRHAAQRLEGRFDQQTAAQLGDSNSKFVEKIRNPLIRRGEFPRRLRFSTTDDQLRVLVLQAGEGRLAAPDAPPDLTGDPELALRMHESLVNNLAEGLLAGETIGQKWLEETSMDLLGKVPDRLKDDPDKDPWTMTLAETKPVTFVVSDGGFTLKVRGTHYTSGDKGYPAMDFTIKYHLERHGKGVKAVRKGDIEMFPPGFVPGRDRFSLTQITLRNLMRKRLQKIFEPELAPKGPLLLPGEWEKVGPLEVTQLGANKGWLTLSWQRDKEAAKATQPRTAARLH